MSGATSVIPMQGLGVVVEAMVTVVRVCICRVSLRNLYPVRVAAYGRQSGHGAENDSSRGRVCQHYLKGSCTFGDRCKFEHPNRSMAGYARYEEKQPRNNVCKHYLNGTCRFGDSCKFEHPSSGWSTGGHMQSTFGGCEGQL